VMIPVNMAFSVFVLHLTVCPLWGKGSDATKRLLLSPQSVPNHALKQPYTYDILIGML
jgi:hypothetical protein